jgi:hypothetical protein
VRRKFQLHDYNHNDHASSHACDCAEHYTEITVPQCHAVSDSNGNERYRQWWRELELYPGGQLRII